MFYILLQSGQLHTCHPCAIGPLAVKGTFVTLWECPGMHTSLSSCADFDLALHMLTQQLLDKDEPPTLECIPHPPPGYLQSVLMSAWL